MADPSPPPHFLAVGHHGLRFLSMNGKEWTQPQLSKEGDVFRFTRFGHGRFVALGTYGGDNIFASSADGQTWHTGKQDAKYAKYYRGLAFGDGKFVAVGGDPGAVGHGAPFLQTSTDGIDWSDAASIGGGFILRRLAYGNDRWVGIGDRGRRATSLDLKEWKDAAGNQPVNTLVDIAFGKTPSGRSVFVGVGLHGLRMMTEDGLTWSKPERGEEGEHLNTILWTGERFAAIGAGATYFSADAVDWERKPNIDAPVAVAYRQNLFIGANWKGRLLRSSDAITWEQVHRAEHHVEAVCSDAG